MSRAWRISAFGLHIESEFPLPGSVQGTVAADDPRRLQLTLGPSQLLAACDERSWRLRNLQAYGGTPYAMLEGVDGGHLFQLGHRTSFELSPDLARLRCCVPPDEPTAWQPVLLDTILWGVSLLRGSELLHCSAVVHEGRLIAFAARTGGGKSSLAAEYLRRGATLFNDDRMAFGDPAAPVAAHPGPAVMNLPATVDVAALPGARLLGELDGERWVQVAGAAWEPMRPSAIVLTERVTDADDSCAPLAANSLDLLAHATLLPRMPGSTRRRFELFNALVESVLVLRLRARPSVAARALADMIDEQLSSILTPDP